MSVGSIEKLVSDKKQQERKMSLRKEDQGIDGLGNIILGGTAKTTAKNSAREADDIKERQVKENSQTSEIQPAKEDNKVSS